MASNPNRFSAYSNFSKASERSVPQQTAQVSTQTLLNALHNAYSASKPYVLESSTSLVVNTWLTATSEGGDGRPAGTVDVELARRAWEHARRRAEDGCVVLGSLHESSTSVLVPFISALPITVPAIFYTALDVLRPFTQCVTPQNAAALQYSSFATIFTLSLEGNLMQASLKLSSSGIDTNKGLLHVPAEKGYRGFDVFYYLLSSASTASEREFLNLQHPSSYGLLKKSDTFDPPSYLPTADDAAAAEEFRNDLKAIGISGSARRDLLSALASLLKLGDTLGMLVDEEVLEDLCEDVAGLLGVDPEVLVKQCSAMEREVLIGGIYEALVDWVIQKANDAIASELRRERLGDAASDSSGPGAHTPHSNDSDQDTVNITVLEIPSQQLGKAAALRNVFDDSQGINAEMKEDGVAVLPAGHSTIAEMRAAFTECEHELGVTGGHAGRDREIARDRRENVLVKVGHETEPDGFLHKLLFPSNGQDITLGKTGRFDLPAVIGSSRVWFHLSLHPTDESPSRLQATSAAWSAGSPSRQLRAWRLPEWANRRNRLLDFTTDFDMDEFCTRYARLGCKEGKDGIESFILERGWSNGEVVIGHERIWIREGAWWEAESMLDMLPEQETAGSMLGGMSGMPSGYRAPSPGISEAYFGSPFADNAAVQSRDNLNVLQRNQSSATLGNRSALGARSLAPTVAQTVRSASGGDYGLGTRGDDTKGAISYLNDLDPELNDPKHIIQQPIAKTRRLWVALVWGLTFWIPSFVLRYAGIMKRPDVRMAWREKLVLMFFIFLLNAFVVFYIVGFGLVLCPNYNKVWNNQEVSYHQGDDDFWVSVHGKVYDISSFWRLQHSNIVSEPVTTAVMQPLAGLNLDGLFPLPLNVACPQLVTSPSLIMTINDTITANLGFVHTFGSQSPYAGTPLRSDTWYSDVFLPRMKGYFKGNLVASRSDIANLGQNEQEMIVVINGQVYDLSNYFYNLKLQNDFVQYKFLDSRVTQMVQSNPGQDITTLWNNFAASDPVAAADNFLCINNLFYVGLVDFRVTARCQANNYILLGFTIILCCVILTKFLAALQLGSKRRPAAQDKFVICQVPCYTEGEDHLRKGLDSLTALAYDNKRKLICVICDGMIVGGGNDRPTPKIVLDILGVDPKIDPPALPFKSVGAGSEQLNYGKVYSGLYEYEGNVVPYIVVVKVGKESEQKKAKPGNRGKRDSQILLMSFLNRVHHRSPMSPLELEMFHQINNIIGVDPELYEYLFMVDADTQVKEDSLTRLVASCANDAKIAGICGETSLENEERSWWTMIQVYEYYISHHLAKAFESLFGSVTCLPGCFCMYRLRTADKGKPLIISDKVIDEYSDCEVDTLHKKNLLSLGEDRYLTTLMTKHFPHMSYKFVPDAYAQTAAPEQWSILLSQRRRWINSTIHNLAELVFIKDMCGFCCFSMRFVVFIDLFGTLILPATCVYLGYLIYRVATKTGQFPLISIVMIAAVYGLQAVVFLIKRQWQHIGWMIIYIMAYPIYSFVLPIYAFWKQDDFSWGNTRIVIGEKGNKQVIAMEDEGFDPRSIPLQRWDDYATANNLPGRRGLATEKEYQGSYQDAYEMDDIRSVYSSVKPASTILTGFPMQNTAYMPPQSPMPYSNVPTEMRQSGYSNFSHYTQQPQGMNGRAMSLGQMSDHYFPPPQQNFPRSPSMPPAFQSTDNLIGFPSPSPQPLNRAGRQDSSNSFFRDSSTNLLAPQQPVNFQSYQSGHGEATDAQIIEAIRACLSVVDLDNVTKKQLKALAEQRLQVQLGPERRAFLDKQIDAELANM